MAGPFSEQYNEKLAQMMMVVNNGTAFAKKRRRPRCPRWPLTHPAPLVAAATPCAPDTLDEGIQHYLGAKLDKFAPGKLWASMDVRDDLVTAVGTLHGGVMASFVDHVLGCVLYPLMKRGQWAATTEFKINYLAPVKSGRLLGESTVVSLTKRTAVVRMDVVNVDEEAGVRKLVCVAQGTLLVSDPPNKKAKL